MGQWTYERVTSGSEGKQRITATLSSVLPLAIGKSGLSPVKLAFIDDPVTGYDCQIQLANGDFHQSSANARYVDWEIEGQLTARVRATRPEATPPRISLRDPRDRWFELEGARMLAVAFRGNDRKRHRVLFDVSCLDRTQLDWDGQRYAEQYRERKAAAA